MIFGNGKLKWLMILAIILIVLILFFYFLAPSAQAPQGGDSGQSAASSLRSNGVSWLQVLDEKVIEPIFGGAKSTPIGPARASTVPAGGKKFYRITFFLTKPLAGSLAIPAEWEGKYGFDEEKNRAVFFCAPAGSAAEPIFEIDIFTKVQWEDAVGRDEALGVLKAEGNYVFANRILQKISKNPSCVEMTDRADEIMKSFKSYYLSQS